MKNYILCATLAFFTSASAAASFEVFITGPGGHSNGNYGNTNAVHAASRAVLELEKAVPCVDISDFRGGATVNAIAADAFFIVNADRCQGDSASVRKSIEEAVRSGCEKENNFRHVKEGDKVRGFPADIKFSLK